jgi:hypothetical protein
VLKKSNNGCRAYLIRLTVIIILFIFSINDMYKLFIISFALFIIGITGTAQDAVLTSRLKGKQNLDDIVKELKSHYSNPATINRIGPVLAERQIKHWRRWLWYMSSRVGEQGELVNIQQKLFEAESNHLQRQSTNNVGILSNAGSWSLLGPTNTTSGIGRIDRLAFHPSDADIVWAGSTAGGLWRTTDGGTSWTNLSPYISSPAISGIAVDPANTNTLYVLTGDGDSNISGLVEDFGYMRLSIGVLKSTNGGATWQKTADFPGADYSSLVGYRLIMHPSNSNMLYACTNQGIFVTINGGDSWGLSLGPGRFYDMAFQPGSGSVCYATSIRNNRASFWKSTSSGLFNSWDSTLTVNNQINNPASRTEIAVTPINPNIVYLLCGGVPNAGGSFGGVYRSLDAGTSFSLRSSTPNILGRASDGSDNASQSTYDLAIAVSNTTSAAVITGGVRCWSSTNSASTWTFRGSHHEDVHDLGFHPADNKLWMANDGGVYTSTDNGATWTSHFSSMSTSQFYRIAVRPDDILQVIAGAQDNGIKRRPGATSTFDHVSGADGFSLDYDAADNSIFYAIRNRDVFRYRNNGANMDSITPNVNINNPFSMSLAAHSTQGNSLFVGSDTLWRTTNGGSTWNFNLINAGWFIRTCPSNGNRVYAAGGTSYQANTGILRRSDDGGVTWPAGNILSGNTGFPVTYPRITSINVDPSNSLNVWVTFGGFTAGTKVFSSTNGGGNWTNRSGTLPNLPINTIALDANNNAYIGTDNGIYYRSTSMSDWVPYYNNLPYVPVTDLVISEADGRIRAGTFGRGIWTSDLYTGCVADVVLGGTLNGQEFFEASNSVTSTSTIQLSEGTKVQMRGGFEVKLMPGFTAQESTAYRAAIGPCGSGGVAGFSTNIESQSPKGEPLQSVAAKRQVVIHIYPGNAFPIKLKLQTKTVGDIHFELNRADGSLVHTWESFSLAAGDVDRELNTPFTIQPGRYKLSVLHNGKMQHWQEVEVK